ncbi:LacI family DNA-binding transcriptional regulator [Amaricoccus solimangrovi]|uniref:LacI family transcriptional regulator n=1 Tax=Amaricoccus solimangrovi TaxID=2589815 RepID=A0A501WIE5_9RHOB|nr:LacI family DNA-binding transcriptional regulator [Amaricoccus solimangrovi]TPE49279.1 LacI family transcriptional regulator [Amaricoccus solimangrovi]
MSDKPASRRRATLDDVAREAGVGIATVDRVLNERGNVSAKTAERILTTARMLGLRRTLPDLHRRALRIEVILPRPELSLIARMNESFARLARRVDRSVVIHRAIPRSDDPKALAARIRDSRSEAIVVYAPDHPEIRAAVAQATARGTAIVTVISDLPGTPRLAYAGTDHYAAGRTAGFLLTRMLPAGGTVLVLRAHFGIQSHAERIRGFSEEIAAHGGARIAEILEGGDDAETSELLLRRAIPRHAPVHALYNVGAGNRAIGAVIGSNLFRAPPLFIGHELTPYTIPMLRDGRMTFALDQNPDLQAAFAIDVILSHFGHAEPGELHPPYESHVPVTLYTPRNLPVGKPEHRVVTARSRRAVGDDP